MKRHVWTQKLKSSLTEGVVDLFWRTFFYESFYHEWIYIFLSANTKIDYASYNFWG